MKQPSLAPLWLIGLGIAAAIGVYVTKVAPQAFFRWGPCLLILCWCACTTVYYPNGKKLACIGSDIESMDIQARGIVVHVVKIQNSTIVRAHGDNITKGGAAIATSGLLPFLSGLFR